MKRGVLCRKRRYVRLSTWEKKAIAKVRGFVTTEAFRGRFNINNTRAMLDHTNKFDDDDAVGDETEEEEMTEGEDEDEETLDMELGYDDETA